MVYVDSNAQQSVQVVADSNCSGSECGTDCDCNCSVDGDCTD